MKKQMSSYTNLILFVLFIILIESSLLAQIRKTVTFKSVDEVTVTADLYISQNEQKPFVIFFHQAGWSRGEYLEIAPQINRLGFNAMAVDQRSGDKVNDVINQTNLDAVKLNKPTNYLDAIPDMISAINYVKENYPKAKIIIWGSSYSSALVLKLAGENTDKIEGVLAFSPAEYFERFGKGKDFISKSAKNIKCPVFITASKKEAARWQPIYKLISSENKEGFIPAGSGHHGSRALWVANKGNEEYWKAVNEFLKKYF